MPKTIAQTRNPCNVYCEGPTPKYPDYDTEPVMMYANG